QSTLDEIPGARNLTTNNDRLGTEADNQVRDTDAELSRSLDEGSLRISFTREGAIDHFDKCRLWRSARQLHIPCDRGALRREGLPTIIAAAPTRNRRTATDDHVPELTGRTLLTTIHLTIEDDPGADAFRNEHEYEIPCVIDFRPSKP